MTNNIFISKEKNGKAANLSQLLNSVMSENVLSVQEGTKTKGAANNFSEIQREIDILKSMSKSKQAGGKRRTKKSKKTKSTKSSKKTAKKSSKQAGGKRRTKKVSKSSAPVKKASKASKSSAPAKKSKGRHSKRSLPDVLRVRIDVLIKPMSKILNDMGIKAPAVIQKLASVYSAQAKAKNSKFEQKENYKELYEETLRIFEEDVKAGGVSKKIKQVEAQIQANKETKKADKLAAKNAQTSETSEL